MTATDTGPGRMIEIVKFEGEDEGFAKTLDDMLDDHAAVNGTPFDPQTVGFAARDGDGAVIGGLYGWAQLGWFFVKLLALAPDARKTGAGGRLLGEAEAHARAEGLSGIYLDTYEFQAPGFYEKMGYTEFGRLPAAGGHPQRIWFAKIFD
ncbi:GNAT family N-acetyltransferase [Oricola sp.]|uniref:GNAT family N-acetyltransferase n=1 Tax=Oricola sp. TaxID=1979950 RepID=UPI0025E159A7|nr:GNAT family N-acetyltransferase [Oricola sp.]MCI5076247.1 GNAT family N-acetyltransferase [Oricola sp.]